MSDADIHWCGDAVAAIKRGAGAADMLIMTEAGYKTLNSGFYYVRANARTRALFNMIVTNAKFGNHDQDVVNAALCDTRFGARRVPTPGQSAPYICVTASGAIVRILNSQRYPSGAETIDGNSIFEHDRSRLERMCRRQRFVVVHNNFIRANQKMKRMVKK
eukprot:IDg13744t1